MTFRKLAFSQKVLRATATPGAIKEAGLARLGVTAGRFALNQAAKHHGVLAPVAIGGAALGGAAAIGHGINKTRSNMIGYDPRIIAAKREMSDE